MRRAVCAATLCVAAVLTADLFLHLPHAITAATGQLAYTCLDRAGTRQICLVSADGTGFRRLTAVREHAEGPVWSPDGRRLAFVRTDGDDTQIYIINADGTGARPLTTLPGIHFAPVWSPDGRQIAYVQDVRGSSQQVHVMTASGRNQRALTLPPAISFAPAWSPDGRYIAYLSRPADGHPELFLMQPDGSGQRQIPTLATGVIPGVSSVAWLPDGQHLIYTARASRAVDEIRLVRTDGTDHRWFSTGYAPSASPDGSSIAYVVSRVGSAQIYIRPWTGATAMPLTDRRWISLRPAWSPDGTRIAFLAIPPGEPLAVWVMRPDGGSLRRLGAAAGNFDVLPVASWRP